MISFQLQCSNSLETTKILLKSMSNVHGIQPSIEHYGCMVDLLGRVGCMAEAEELIQNMPMAADHSVLGGVLVPAEFIATWTLLEKQPNSFCNLIQTILEHIQLNGKMGRI
ncbi:MAG: hypothetical protein Q8761_02690 [Sweet potato little leaf phytoplasma]|nr:hypothetical protein [Sweet potato little leaf phytoplasma]